MNENIYTMEGRTFVKDDKNNYREVKPEPNIKNKLQLENLKESLCKAMITQYGRHIAEKQDELKEKKEEYNLAKYYSSRHILFILVGTLLFALVSIITMPGILNWFTHDKFDIIEGIINDRELSIFSSICLSVTAGIIETIIIPYYVNGKKDVKRLEEEIPSLEQEISDGQREKAILEAKMSTKLTTTINTDAEVISLVPYTKLIEGKISSKFQQIQELEDAKNTLVELIHSDELDSSLAHSGFTSEEVASAKETLAKEFTMQPIQPQNPNQQ